MKTAIFHIMNTIIALLALAGGALLIIGFLGEINWYNKILVIMLIVWHYFDSIDNYNKCK